MRYAPAVLIVATLAGLPLPAQQLGTAGIYGAVTDAQGAVIPGAKVTLIHVERNQERLTTTSEGGQYVFPLIPVGSYRIRVEHPGFKAFEQAGIELQVNDNRKIDVLLEVGDIATRVVVEAAAAAVETSTATLKSVVDGRRILELPLNGRNVADLTGLLPGAQDAGASGGSAKTPSGVHQYSVNGSRQNNLKFTLDGGDNQDNLTNVNMPFPFPDAVEEFSVQTNAGPEIGKSSAGAVNVVTKSGTNEFHGDGFWFVRNSALNAKSYFLHQSDLLKRNQAGFTIGGPVVKNKLFFFAGLQQTWIRTAPTESKTLTMIAPFRQGDFSSLLSQSKPTVISDPSSGQPFPNNTIPASRQSPAAQNLLKYSPLPGADGFNRWVVSALEDLREPVFRVDYRPNQKHSILGRYYQNTDESDRTFDPNNLHTVANVQSAYTKNATSGYTFVASSQLIADTHVSVARTFGKRTNGFPKTIADFGVNVHPSSNQISVSINGTSGLSLSTVNPPARFARTNLELTHSWRWSKGRHNWIWGVDLMTSRYNEYNLFLGSGSYSFQGRYTGFDQADYILGLLNQFDQSNGEIEFRRYHYQGFYGGDSFRVSRRLTLNYGLRWEPYTPLTDLNDREVQFRQDAYLKGIRSTRYVNAPPGLYYPGDNVSGYTIPKAGVQASKKQFAPRIGLAWDVTGDGKTSLRAGYGLFFDSPMLYVLNNMNVQTPFSFTVTFRDGVFDNPFRGRENLNVFPFSGDFDPKSPFQIPTSAVVYEPVWRQPYTQDWNLTLERRLTSSWLVQLSYVGTKGTNLDGNRDLNAPIYDYSKTLAQNRSTINQRRPRPEFQDLTSLFTGLNSIYNSFQSHLTKRFSHGFSAGVAYTWSRAIDYQSANKEVTTQRVQNPFNIRMTRGPSDYDRMHRFTSSFVWNLPRAGKALHSRWVGALTDDWQFSGIVSLTTGSPFGINSTNDQVAGAGAARADLAGNLFLPSGRSRGDKIAQYFNINAAVQAQPGSYGNLGRNVLRNPNSSSTDVSLTRGVPLKFREAASLTFRAEFFSLFNHPQLAGPDSRLGRSTFGQILNVGGQRVLQFGLKVGF